MTLWGQLKNWETPDQLEIDQMVRCPHNRCCPPENEVCSPIFSDHTITHERSKRAVQELMLKSLVHHEPCMSVIPMSE